MARFIASCAMRWSDMDAYGHINNTAYLAYLEQARVSMFFDRYDSSFAAGTVVAHHEISYVKPVVYHAEPLQLQLWVANMRAASFDVHCEVYDLGVLAARATTKLVSFDFTRSAPRRLTEEERVVLLGCAEDAQTVTDPAISNEPGVQGEPGSLNVPGVLNVPRTLNESGVRT